MSDVAPPCAECGHSPAEHGIGIGPRERSSNCDAQFAGDTCWCEWFEPMSNGPFNLGPSSVDLAELSDAPSR
jgi:hypothetical protein